MTPWTKHPRLLPIATSALVALAAAAARADPPFRLGEALGLPESVSLTLQHRARYEFLDDQFRAGRSGDDQLLSLRTSAHLRWQVTGGLAIGAEVMDSRVHLDDSDTPVGTANVNAAELIQAYVELASAGPLGGRSALRVGRLTMDVGSRRLVARSRFRNTVNVFSGFDWQWQRDDGRSLRAFWTMPLRRRPFSEEVLDNDVQLDEESLDLQLWGLQAGAALPGGGGGGGGDRLEALFLGLHEEAGAALTRNRDLYTPSLRLRRAPRTGALDYEIESAMQFGSARLSGTEDLDHLAHWHHVEAGYSFAAPWRPRIALEYDYASGDEDPDDGDDERFDTLFGKRRGDYGPTSLYGPFRRANLHGPGLRASLRPTARLSGMAGVRAFWLAERRDAWAGTGVRDAGGDSGRHLGTQLELRIRFDFVPGNVQLEAGAAHLFAGGFAERAPNANGQGDSTYAYLAINLDL